jgi:hypothetical protein
MTDDTTWPTTLDAGRRQVSTLDRLANISEEEIWLQKQKSARTRRAYRLDVQLSCARFRSRRRRSCATPTTRR